MKKLGILTGLLFSLLNGTTMHAQAADAFYQVGKVTSEVVSVEETPIIEPEQFVPTNPATPIPTIPPILTTPGMGQPGQPNPLMIVDLALKAWQIIKDGKPVVNVSSKNASALPYIASGRWEALTGWKSERAITYRIKVENVYGIETVDFEYRVSLLYGGNVGGKGKFIASARVIPTKVDVLWGYNLDVGVDVPNIYNVATPEDPNASIMLDVTYKVSTILRSTSYTNTYEVRGDGTMKENGNTLIGPAACFLK